MKRILIQKQYYTFPVQIFYSLSEIRQSFDDMPELRKLNSDCEPESLWESLLRDTLKTGLNNNKLKELKV